LPVRELKPVRVLALDVTKPDSIAAALDASGAIDVPVNNAGIGVFGHFEATPMATTRDVFETNAFGVFALTHRLSVHERRQHATWRAARDLKLSHAAFRVVRAARRSSSPISRPRSRPSARLFSRVHHVPKQSLPMRE
jgi:NAD(P)-dependent dehydrogenase (short-subunit alcohol dehydrogenase family)